MNSEILLCFWMSLVSEFNRAEMRLHTCVVLLTATWTETERVQYSISLTDNQGKPVSPQPRLQCTTQPLLSYIYTCKQWLSTKLLLISTYLISHSSYIYCVLIILQKVNLFLFFKQNFIYTLFLSWISMDSSWVKQHFVCFIWCG